MKTANKLRGIWLIAGMLVLTTSLFAFHGDKGEMIDTINFKAYYGRIIDSESGRALPFATITAEGSNIATVSNIDGDFTIKVAKDISISISTISPYYIS